MKLCSLAHAAESQDTVRSFRFVSIFEFANVATVYADSRVADDIARCCKHCDPIWAIASYPHSQDLGIADLDPVAFCRWAA